MKKGFLLFLFVFCFLYLPPVTEANINTHRVYKELEAHKTVIICTGEYATRYHNNIKCNGLQRCKSNIIRISLKKAKRKNRTPCKLCYRYY